jgi:solute carrier family 25 carnitine/acylcarnitine transporter 20/29
MIDTEVKNGIVAGITRAIISQPFDTVKTQMQYGNYKNARSCLKSVVKKQGVLFLYKGLTFPLLGNSLIVGAHFHIYNELKRYSSLVAGASAGFVASFISNPVELVRIKMQLSGANANNKKYKNSFECLKQIIHHNGVRGIFKGQRATTLRDIIGYSAFFSAYEMYPGYKNSVGQYLGDNPILHKMIRGTLCGFALWGSMYPIDVVKTVVQGSLLENKQTTYREYVKDIFAKYGLRGFYRGFYLTMVRAVPVNIGIVMAVDLFN